MRKFHTPSLVAMALSVVALSLAACGKKAPEQAPPPPEVSIAAPIRERVMDWDDFTGRFEAPESVEVRARAGGYLQAAHFREGQAVRKGQLLFTLDPRPAQAQLAAAQAQAAQARSELKRAEALLADQAISREEYEGRKASAQVAEASLRSRQLDVEFTRVTAPISGIVSQRRIDPGNVIAGGTSAGDILTTIVSVDPIHFAFDASEAQALKYQRQAKGRDGAAVRIRLQDEAEPRHTGVVDFFDNQLDQGSGTIRLRARVANPGGLLRAGMFGSARMASGLAYDALLIPETAVASDGARKVAYVVAANGEVQAKGLTLGPQVGSLRVVRAGLQANDRVIVNGLQKVRPGQKATPKSVTVPRSAAGPVNAPTPAAPMSTTATPAG